MTTDDVATLHLIYSERLEELKYPRRRVLPYEMVLTLRQQLLHSDMGHTRWLYRRRYTTFNAAQPVKLPDEYQ